MGLQVEDDPVTFKVLRRCSDSGWPSSASTAVRDPVLGLRPPNPAGGSLLGLAPDESPNFSR